MRVYWRYFLTALQYYFTYKYHRIAELFLSILTVGVHIFVWRVVTLEHDSVGGYGFEQFVIYYLIIQVISVFSQSGVMLRMDWWVRQGLMASEFIKPVSVRMMLFMASVAQRASKFVVLAPAIILILILTGTIEGIVNRSVLDLVVLSVNLLVFFLFVYAWEFLWGTLIFYAKDAEGYRGIVWNIRRVLSGRLMPLNLLPAGIVNVLMFLPFANGVFVPAQFLMGSLDYGDVGRAIVNLLLWAGLFFVLGNVAWDRAVRNFEAVGQ